ncbi:MAG: 4-hydroxy-tetrahydrodipicolinate reductase [Gammaproteobacteria bacterium]|nr:4-hydroxy-tetrahydrodipicolinate reductase [Gammaproteobacteria bacterium]MDE2251044.1 4-hydroxy-tetrahydrodipicolinate reductase [Gammaproteobacteria bacterium]
MKRGAAVAVVILGAPGRMGTSLLRLLPSFAGLRLHAAVAAAGNPAVGRDSGELAGVAPNGVRVRPDAEAALEGAGLALDFSTAAAAAAHVAACEAQRVPLLLGTTGLGPELPAMLERAARRIPLLVTANTSLGVAVLQELVHAAAAALGAGFDVQVCDAHHGAKRDAPSGTALTLGAAAADGGQRPAQRIGYASIRGGDVVGDHEVHFLGQGERLCLSHSATDRSVFARGALQSGSWLARRPPGRYAMTDVLREK